MRTYLPHIPASERHHLLPVMKSLAHLDWHLRHLFDDGWKTVVDMERMEHRRMASRVHVKKGMEYSPLPLICFEPWNKITRREQMRLWESKK